MQGANSERLIESFEKVFPNLGREEIVGATSENTAAWDSIAQITLLSLIGETFGIDIDFEEFEGATSFSAILELVNARTANG